MTVSIPDSVLAEGNVKVVFVPTLASVTAPTAVALNAGVDISCYLMAEWDGPTPTQNTGESRRFCSRESFQRLGRTTWAIPPLTYTYGPQDDAGEINAARDALAPDTEGYLVIGYGLDPAEDFTAGDFVDVFPVECGVQAKPARGADEFAPLTITQTLAVTSTVSQDSLVA